jgi:regulation of enolase protein 1 (concanavalin A-like superfamily)
MAVSSGNGLAFQRRTQTGGQSEHGGLAGAAPRWVRLVRAGNRVQGYASSDGSAWTLVGETSIAFGAQVLVGMAVTSHNNAALNTSVFENVVLETAAPIFAATDVGGSLPAGSTAVNNGVHTLSAGGADIWGTADKFHFHHRPMSGDGEIRARVASLTNTNPWAKAGVMIRETTAEGSRHVYMGLTPANGAEFLRRDIVYSTTAATGTPATAPSWVRLTRAGNVFTAYVSANGATWTQVGTATIAMGADTRVGLAACSHDTGRLLTGVFDNVTVVE